jgi:hypothetical protein
MTAGVDDSAALSYDAASINCSVRASPRRASPTSHPGDGTAAESPEQQTAADRAALLRLLESITELLTVWHDHLTATHDRPIEHAEVERFVERLEKIDDDIMAHIFGEDSLLSRLGYSVQVDTRETSPAGPRDQLMTVLYPYRNALRRTDLSSLRDDPVKAMEFEDLAYRRSKDIRKHFAEYRKRLNEQLSSVRDLLEHGN